MDGWNLGPPVLVGERVKWSNNSGNFYVGTVRWIGKIPEISITDWTVGIELDNALPVGGIDGTWRKRKLFKCTPNHGLLVPMENVIRLTNDKSSPKIDKENQTGNQFRKENYRILPYKLFTGQPESKQNFINRYLPPPLSANRSADDVGKEQLDKTPTIRADLQTSENARPQIPQKKSKNVIEFSEIEIAPPIREKRLSHSKNNHLKKKRKNEQLKKFNEESKDLNEEFTDKLNVLSDNTEIRFQDNLNSNDKSNGNIKKCQRRKNKQFYQNRYSRSLSELQQSSEESDFSEKNQEKGLKNLKKNQENSYGEGNLNGIRKSLEQLNEITLSNVQSKLGELSNVKNESSPVASPRKKNERKKLKAKEPDDERNDADNKNEIVTNHESTNEIKKEIEEDEWLDANQSLDVEITTKTNEDCDKIDSKMLNQTILINGTDSQLNVIDVRREKNKGIFSFLKWFKRNKNIPEFDNDASVHSSPLFARNHNASCGSIDTLLSTATVTSFAFVPPTQYQSSIASALTPCVPEETANPLPLPPEVPENDKAVDNNQKVSDVSEELSLGKRKKRRAPEPPKCAGESLPNSFQRKRSENGQHRRTVSESFKDKKAGAYCHVQGKRKAPSPPKKVLYPSLDRLKNEYPSLIKKKKPAPQPPIKCLKTNEAKSIPSLEAKESDEKPEIEDKSPTTPDLNKITRLPSKPWYKRKENAKNHQKHTKKDKDEEWIPEIGFARSNLPDEINLGKFKLFSRSDDKKEKRKSQITILANISELDREAAEIVRKEQAQEKEILDAEDEKFYTNFDWPIRNSTKGLISMFNAISDDANYVPTVVQNHSNDKTKFNYLNIREKFAEIFEKEKIHSTFSKKEDWSAPSSPKPWDSREEGKSNWICKKCTLENDKTKIICGACNIPRNSAFEFNQPIKSEMDFIIDWEKELRNFSPKFERKNSEKLKSRMNKFLLLDNEYKKFDLALADFNHNDKSNDKNSKKTENELSDKQKQSSRDHSNDKKPEKLVEVNENKSNDQNSKKPENELNDKRKRSNGDQSGKIFEENGNKSSDKSNDKPEFDDKYLDKNTESEAHSRNSNKNVTKQETNLVINEHYQINDNRSDKKMINSYDNIQLDYFKKQEFQLRDPKKGKKVKPESLVITYQNGDISNDNKVINLEHYDNSQPNDKTNDIQQEFHLRDIKNDKEVNLLQPYQNGDIWNDENWWNPEFYDNTQSDDKPNVKKQDHRQKVTRAPSLVTIEPYRSADKRYDKKMSKQEPYDDKPNDKNRKSSQNDKMNVVKDKRLEEPNLVIIESYQARDRKVTKGEQPDDNSNYENRGFTWEYTDQYDIKISDKSDKKMKQESNLTRNTFDASDKRNDNKTNLGFHVNQLNSIKEEFSLEYVEEQVSDKCDNKTEKEKNVIICESHKGPEKQEQNLIATDKRMNDQPKNQERNDPSDKCDKPKDLNLEMSDTPTNDKKRNDPDTTTIQSYDKKLNDNSNDKKTDDYDTIRLKEMLKEMKNSLPKYEKLKADLENEKKKVSNGCQTPSVIKRISKNEKVVAEPVPNGAKTQNLESQDIPKKKEEIKEHTYANLNKEMLDLQDGGSDNKDNDNANDTNLNTLCVNQLLKKLEAAIANGQHSQAADLAKELAKLKINCNVTRQKLTADVPLTEITVDLYVEDKSSHQGPIPLKVATDMTVTQLKLKIEKEFEIPTKAQRWILGKQLASDDTKTLENHGVTENHASVFLYLVAQKNDVENKSFSKPSSSLNQPEVIDHEEIKEPEKNQKRFVEEVCLDSESEDEILTDAPKTTPNEPKNEAPIVAQALPESPKDRIPTPKKKNKPILVEPRVNEALKKDLKVISANSVKETIDKLQKTAATKNGRIAISGWKCRVCTLINSSARPGCAACSAQRPTDNVTPMPYKTNDILSRRAGGSSQGKSNNEFMDDKLHYLQLLHLDNTDLVPNTENFDCPICLVSYNPGEGVILRECLHTFCRNCLINTVRFNEEAEVKCPYRDNDYSCESILQQREIKALVPKTIFEKHLARSVSQAENKIGNAFHCKTPDCQGWCILEDNVNEFRCPVCNLMNCLTCQAVHNGKNCKEYQEQMRQASETNVEAKRSREMLEQMVEKGEAMACPTCQVVLMKKWGCDWLKCSMCKTEICWVTRGPRWGPGGKGDTSAGCQCGVNGVKCHPKCNYCH